jgi:microcystin-dependent protein
METRNFQAGAAGSPPSAPVTPSNGYATNGNPALAVPATQPGEFWFHKIGEELRAILTDRNVTPSDSILNQISTAIATSYTGHVVFFATSTAPTGFLKANGAAVSRSTYAALFALIGTSFGSGNGSTTFNIPDLRGEFLRGYDDGRGIDSGRSFGSYQKGTFMNIDCGSTLAVVGNSTSSSGAAGAGQSDIGLDAATIGEYPNALECELGSATRLSPGNAAEKGYGSVRPRNIALLACIGY